MQVYRKIRVKLDKEKKEKQLRETFISYLETEKKKNEKDLVRIKPFAFVWLVFLFIRFTIWDGAFLTFMLPFTVITTIAYFFGCMEEKKYIEKVSNTLDREIDEIVETALECPEFCYFAKEKELVTALIAGQEPIEIQFFPKRGCWYADAENNLVRVFCRDEDDEVFEYVFCGNIVFKANQKNAVLNMDGEVLYLPFRGFAYSYNGNEGDR